MWSCPPPYLQLGRPDRDTLPGNISFNGRRHHADKPSVFGVILLLLAVGVAVLAYRESESFKWKNGVTPWGMPSWVWAILGFFSLIICAVLLAIARHTTQPRVVQPSVWPINPASVLAAAPPGWHPDPSGRHQFRYWDGHAWTPHVSNSGVSAIDRP